MAAVITTITIIPNMGSFCSNVGRGFPMRDHHRRYWGEKRQYHDREQVAVTAGATRAARGAIATMQR